MSVFSESKTICINLVKKTFLKMIRFCELKVVAVVIYLTHEPSMDCIHGQQKQLEIDKLKIHSFQWTCRRNGFITSEAEVTAN